MYGRCSPRYEFHSICAGFLTLLRAPTWLLPPLCRPWSPDPTLDISPWVSNRHLKPDASIMDLSIFLSKSAPHSPAFPASVKGTAVHTVAQATNLRVRLAPSLAQNPPSVIRKSCPFYCKIHLTTVTATAPTQATPFFTLTKAIVLTGFPASSQLLLQPILYTGADQVIFWFSF